MGMGYRIEVARSIIDAIVNSNGRRGDSKMLPSSSTDTAKNIPDNGSSLSFPEDFTPASPLHDRPLGPVPQVRILYDFTNTKPTKKPTSRELDGY